MTIYELIHCSSVNGKEIKENELFSDYDLAIERYYQLKDFADSAQIYRYKERDGKFIMNELIASF